MPQGSMSAIPWRKAGLKYTSNEFYMDIIESIDALIDAYGEQARATRRAVCRTQP